MKRKLVATFMGLFVVFSAFAANLNHVMMTSIKSGNIPVSEGFSSLFDGFWLFAILAAILCIGIAVGLYVLVSIRSWGQILFCHSIQFKVKKTTHRFKHC